jgi:hypothetical protein
VAVDSVGNLIIADYSNNRIRVVAAVNGTKWGIKDMDAGSSTPWPAAGTPSG